MTTPSKAARDYPAWICSECGDKHGRWPEGHCATWHNGECGWCGGTRAVTEPRDYRWPKWPVRKEDNRDD